MSNLNCPNWMSKDNQFRFNPLTGNMIQVSTKRLQRVWKGTTSATTEALPEFEEKCVFCPGNTRANGFVAPKTIEEYPYFFQNDTPALESPKESSPKEEVIFGNGLFHAVPAFGQCEVIVHHPKHNYTLAKMSREHAIKVFKLWANRYKELGALPHIKYVNIFENFLFGSSQPHPHNQLWATSTLSTLQQTILQNLQNYKIKTGRAMIEDIVATELECKERVVFENASFVGVVPFWAEWPYEMMIMPRVARNSLLDLNEDEMGHFADAYRTAISLLNRLFKGDCPYSVGLYQAPTDGLDHEEGMFYLMVRPPVLRDIKNYKWMVGYELMSMLQRDLPPEVAAYRLVNSEA